MGWKYRKSINLGGGFRVNFSNSGVGYSWGSKHFRITKTATGKIRTTHSIPGTGLSHVSEINPKKQAQTQPVSNNMESVEISDVENMNSDIFSEIIAIANKTLQISRISLIATIIFAILSATYIICVIPLVVSAVFLYYSRVKGKVQLDYESSSSIPYTNLSELSDIIPKSSVVWHINAIGDIKEKRKSSGASNTIKRTKCKVSHTAVFPFSTNLDVITLKTGGLKITIFPDKIIVIKKNRAGAVDFADLNINTGYTNFIEDKSVPKDAIVVSQTYQYVNNNGTPDKRYKNNPLRPVCKYTLITITSNTEFKEVLMLSKAPTGPEL